jgi:hypothetical protein
MYRPELLIKRNVAFSELHRCSKSVKKIWKAATAD